MKADKHLPLLFRRLKVRKVLYKPQFLFTICLLDGASQIYGNRLARISMFC